MASITTENNIILNATRGEDVRDAIVGACKKISAESLPDVTEDDAGKKMVVTQDGAWSLEVIQDG